MTQNTHSATEPLTHFLLAQAETSALSFGADDPDIGRFHQAARKIEAFTALAWQLNETLSALYEGHVEQHMDGAGNPIDCELCSIWRTGVAKLKEELAS